MTAKLELVPKHVAAISEAVDLANTLLKRTMELVPQTIAAMVRAGQLLLVERAEREQGEWMDWLKFNVPNISRETARKWIRLAVFNKTHAGKLNDATSVRQAYQLAGLLPEAESGSSSSGKSNDRDAYLVHLLRSQTYLSAQLAAQPLESWPAERKSELKQKLEPFVAVYSRL